MRRRVYTAGPRSAAAISAAHRGLIFLITSSVVATIWTTVPATGQTKKGPTGAVTRPPAAQVDDLTAILNRYNELEAAGNYAAALTEAQNLERGVKARFGVNHANYGFALNNLATVHQAQGQYGEAEGLYKLALAIKERAFGANHHKINCFRATKCDYFRVVG